MLLWQMHNTRGKGIFIATPLQQHKKTPKQSTNTEKLHVKKTDFHILK